MEALFSVFFLFLSDLLFWISFGIKICTSHIEVNIAFKLGFRLYVALIQTCTEHDTHTQIHKLEGTINLRNIFISHYCMNKN